MRIIGQVVDLPKESPLGLFIAGATALAIFGWWVYYYPQAKAAKGLIELRKSMEDWIHADQARHTKLWEDCVELQKRIGSLEGELARMKAERGGQEDEHA